MFIVPNEIKRFIHSETESILEDLSYFENLLYYGTILNRLGVLKEGESTRQITQLFSVDEIFNGREFNFEQDYHEYERERLISNVHLDKETNKLYRNIAQLSLQEFLDENEYNIDEISEEEIENLRLQLYHDTVFDLLVKYTNALEKIRSEYDLKSIDEKVAKRDSILCDPKISLFNPLLFRHEEWEKVVINELMLSNSIEEIERKKTLFIENLIELENLLPWEFKNLPLIDINETVYWLCQWDEHKDLFVYPIHFWLGRKRFFLESLGKSKLKRLFNKDLVRRYNEAKKTAQKLKNQLKRGKIELKQEKYIKPVRQGMTYLLSKENPNLSKSELRQIANKIIANLFYLNNAEPEEYIIETSIKINKYVLIEFILFLKNEKQYFLDKKLSIPVLISDSLNYSSKGFSYKTLNRIYNELKGKKVFDFNGLTSKNALSNEMKMRT